MAGEKVRVEGYLGTANRMEPDIHMIDAGAFYASAAISLKRMADAAEIGNRLRVLELQFRSKREKDEHDDWLRRHGLGDMIDQPKHEVVSSPRPVEREDLIRDLTSACGSFLSTMGTEQHDDAVRQLKNCLDEWPT